MKNSTLQKIAIFSSALFVGASAIYVYSPIIGSHAAESKDTEVNLTVNSSLALRTSANELNLEANVGSFVSGTVDVDVTTNSQYGYTLTLEDSDDDASMVHTNASISDAVSSLYTGAKTSSTMTDNTWGFSLDSTNFYMIPTLNNPVALKQTIGAVSGDYDRTPVDFGAKVGMTLTAGTYTDTVKFTAYVNGVDNNPAEDVELLQPGTPPETRTIADITNMQEMNSKICANTALHATATLVDTRNNETYSVAKLKDGHCWMTKNLALIDYTLTSADSDVPDGFSFHVPGEGQNETPAPGAQNPYYFQYKFAYLDSTYGGYYNYHTAVGGWPGETIETDVNSPQSICPKNWRLPTGTYGGEYEELWSQYRQESNYKLNILMGDILKFNLNGQIGGGGSTTDSPISGAGEFGSWWSASGYSGYSYAQYMWIEPTDTNYDRVNPNGYASPSYGFGVRCIAR